MANEQNLKPFSELTESQQREIRSKGGHAAAKARRKRRTMAQFAKMIAKAPVTDEDAKEALRGAGIEDEEMINAALVVFGVYRAAIMGDMKAVDKWQQLTEGTAPTPESTIKIIMSGSIEDLAK